MYCENLLKPVYTKHKINDRIDSWKIRWLFFL